MSRPSPEPGRPYEDAPDVATVRPREAAEIERQTSVVICTRSRPELLLGAVLSVLDGTHLPAEIVVVDQSEETHPGLPDGEDAGCKVRYHHRPGKGLSRARNEALQLVQHPVVVFIDDDVIVEGSWLSRILMAFRNGGGAAVITGRVLPAAADVEPGFTAPNSDIANRQAFEGRVGVDPLITFNMAARRRILQEVGGFDERLGPGTTYPAGEDNDLAYRLLVSGRRIVVEPHAVVYHRAWRPMHAYVPLQWQYGRGHGAFFAKHIRTGDYFMLRRFVGTLVRVTVRAPLHLLREERQRIPRRYLCVGDFAFAAGTLAGALHWLLRYRPASSAFAMGASTDVA